MNLSGSDVTLTFYCNINEPLHCKSVLLCARFFFQQTLKRIDLAMQECKFVYMFTCCICLLYEPRVLLI